MQFDTWPFIHFASCKKPCMHTFIDTFSLHIVIDTFFHSANCDTPLKMLAAVNV